MKSHNKAVKSDAIDSVSKAHGFTILCAFDAPLLRRLPLRYASFSVSGNPLDGP